MENRYLYRGKRIDNGEWVEGLPSYNKNGQIGEIKVFDDTDITFHIVDPSTICRCTGSKDKNDKLIYENDILSDGDTKSLVRWDSEKASFVIDDYGIKGMLMEYGFDESMGEYGVVDTNGFDDFFSGVDKIFEIIGNKCDNNNLLEGNMKENEAIEILKDFDKQVTAKADGAYQTDIGKMACDTAIKALEEVQQYRKNGITVENAVENMCNLICAESLIAEYRAIGTVDECRAAVDKQTAKKPYLEQAEMDECWECPTCDSFIGYEVDCRDEHYRENNCPNCGQKLDWSDVE